MLTALAFIGIVAILVAAFMVAKFVGFRRHLMAAFSRRGIPYSVADNAYFRAADFINSMAGDKTADEIVEEVLKRYPELF